MKSFAWLPYHLTTLQHLQIRYTTEAMSKMAPRAPRAEEYSLPLSAFDIPKSGVIQGLCQTLAWKTYAFWRVSLLCGVTPVVLYLPRGTALHIVSYSVSEAQSVVL